MDSKNSIMPYVGVSGVVSPEVQKKLEIAANEAGLFENHKLAFGVKATHKTQYLDCANKYGQEWYPVGEADFRDALCYDESSADTISVAQVYLDLDFVGDENYRKQFIEKIKKRGHAWLQAVQFDMLPWHDDLKMLDFLEQIKISSNLDIFLQCHKNAMEDLGPKGVIRRLGNYATFINYILFDSSHGTGKELDVARLDDFLYEANAGLDTSRTGLAIAGGLNAENVKNSLPYLLSKYPNLSWDAEGRLHPVNEHGKRPLDIDLAIDYITASADVISNNSK